MGTTPKYGLPYPEPSTLITESAAIVKSLAEKIDAALSAVGVGTSYTVPGTLVGNVTASGTWTPPPGVTLVGVVVIGGGGTGAALDYSAGIRGHFPGGGSGGGVRVYRGVPVSTPVAVTIGGAGTASAFGALTAPGGNVGAVNSSTPSPNLERGCGDSPLPAGYKDGPTVNGTHYAGGGGRGSGLAEGNNSTPGGAGGGGGGSYSTDIPPGAGTAGTGGGGGGGRYGALGGSGRVMIFTEQATRRGGATLFGDNVPDLYAALDAAGVLLGVYAVDSTDPQVPGVDLEHLIPYPTSPVDTGRVVTVPVDPADPDGPTHEVPVLAWPGPGWTHTPADGWKEPTP